MTAAEKNDPAISIRADFQGDLRTHYLAELSALGVPPPTTQDVERVCIAYFNIAVRLITPRPRIVFRSAELTGRLLQADLAGALDAIEAASLAGDDLRPRMSKLIADPQYHDACFNEWRIHHFHLGRALSRDGFIERTGELLYVMVDRSALYMIDVRKHGAESWANEELLQIVHDNWPDIIADARARNVVPGSLEPATIAPRSREQLRRKFNFGWQAADGTVYVGIGGGMMCGGLSARVREAVDRVRTRAQQIEDFAKQNAHAILDAVRKCGHDVTELDLEYIVGEPPRVMERRTAVLVHLT